MNNTILRLAIGGLFYLVAVGFLEQFLPGWVFEVVAPAVPWVVFGIALLFPQLGPTAIKTLILYTSPFWIWAASRYVVERSPIADAFPAGDFDAVLLVVAPTGVAILGWLYWFLMRWQEISRTAIVPIALIYHASTFVLVLIGGRMTEAVAAWGLASLAVSLFLAGSMNADSGRRPAFLAGSGFCAVAAGTVFAVTAMGA